MKYSNLAWFAIVLLTFISCTDKDGSAQYAEEFSIKLNETITFNDGNAIKITDIRDQFCCCFCDCKWEGELVIEVETTNALGEIENKTFGSSLKQEDKDIFEDYVVSSINYLYDNQPDSLPLCEGDFDQSKVELIFIISKK
ncbi:MAG: hypothetical protein P1U56_09855 [Saprospiraceae bacterium]|nr:hypothetical protein [Saprospiraceae bacterium]